MAITLNDLKERLECVKEEIQQQNYGMAYSKICNLTRILEESGVAIHATATIANKKVLIDDGEEN